jgi:hypothetical protein
MHKPQKTKADTKKIRPKNKIFPRKSKKVTRNKHTSLLSREWTSEQYLCGEEEHELPMNKLLSLRD